MTQKQNSNVPAIIVCILLFGMISFVTNLASPMGEVLKYYLAGQEIAIPNWMATLGVLCNFIAKSRCQLHSTAAFFTRY